MCSTGRLSITRKKRALFGGASFNIFLDDKSVGNIGNGKTLIFELEDGTHSVYVKCGLLTSKSKEILIKTGQAAHLVLDMARGGLFFYIAPTLGFTRFKGFFVLSEEGGLSIKGIPHIFEIVTEKKL